MIVSFHDVCSREGIRNLDLSLDLGGTTLLYDPSEKLSRSILNAIVGLDEILQGEIRIEGALLDDFLSASPQIRNFGYVFDEGIMLSNLSLKENLLLPLRWLDPNLNEVETVERILALMRDFSLELDLNQRPVVYRAGELKLLSYVRTLMIDPKVLLIDDPYYILNKRERSILLQVLQDLKKHFCMLISSNDDDFLTGFADQVVDLSSRAENFVSAASLS